MPAVLPLPRHVVLSQRQALDVGIDPADINSDKTVSDQERAVYEAKQRRQAEETAAKEQADPAGARTAEVRSAYGLDSEAAPALDITALSRFQPPASPQRTKFTGSQFSKIGRNAL